MSSAVLSPVEWSNPFIRKSTNECWYSHKANAIWLQTNAPIELLQDVARHELSHFLLHCSSPYGHLLEELDCLQQQLAIRIALDYSDTLYYPVYNFAHRILSDPANGKASSHGFAREATERVRPWSRSVFLERVLEGEKLPSVRSATIEQVIPLLEEFERRAVQLLADEPIGSEPGGTPEQWTKIPSELLVGDGQLSACPTSDTPTGINPIGGSHVLEGFAQVLERAEIMDTLHEKHDTDRYLGLFVHTMATFGLNRINSEAAMERVRSTFLALCDLALFIPVGGLYGRLRPESTTWEDVHPGHRFLEALAEVADWDLWIDDLCSEVKQFQEDLCERLYWTPPTEFLKLGAGLESNRFANHRDACRLRLEHYHAFLEYDDLLPATRAFFSEHMPLIYTPKRGKADFNRSRGIGPVVEYFLANFTWSFMMNDSIEPADSLPRYVNYSDYFANIHDQQGMLRLMYEASPYLRPDRFRPLSELNLD